MTTQSGSDRSHESVINDTLARILRERLGFSAVAEALVDGRRPDVIVRLPQAAPVILEIELEPARTVDADALSRLGMELDGAKVQNVFAVTVPARLRTVDQQRLFDRLAAATLQWREWRSDGTSGPKLSGTVAELGNAVTLAIPPSGDLEETVNILDEGARRAGAMLYTAPGTLARVAKVFRAPPGDEVAHMAALVIINAMLFQDRLAREQEMFRPVIAARQGGAYSSSVLLQLWEAILEVDYYPIFIMAKDVVEELSSVEAPGILEECARTTELLADMGAVGRHDLAGMIFNRLITDRKLLAAFYTSIPASTILAGLALSPDRWPRVDWTNVEDLEEMSVVDPACGTGTLLMAAYRQIFQNYAASDVPTPEVNRLHKALVERVLFGADVVQAAIHLTAATLAAMSPTVRFAQMQLHTLFLRIESSGDIQLGSLDWLKAPQAQAFFSGSEEQVGAKNGNGDIVQRPEADLVISNPPFTRRGSDGGKGEALVRVLSAPEDGPESQRAIARRTSELLRGTPANQMAGHGASFTVLADRMVKPGGRLALVLPVTALFGESWRGIRQMLSSRYEVEFVVSSHDPGLRSLSYDTSIAETLVVARRLREGESPSRRGVFVNLWRAAYRETDSLAITNAVNAAASAPVHGSDGPPVGGSPVMVGGEQWGEIMHGPLGPEPWKAARWRNGATAQFAAALERGELWAADGTRAIARIPVAPMRDVCNVGPQDRRIRGSLGVFDGFHGWNEQAQFPALWSLDSSVHKGLTAEPNAFLVPKPGITYQSIWSQAGALHVSRDVRYNAQPIMAVRTNVRTLGVRAWYTLKTHDDDPTLKTRREAALALWSNCTLGLMLHANRSNRSQDGRGQGSKGMLEAMSTLDVRKLRPWQLDAAQDIWRDFSDRKFESFHLCAVDPDRIELDGRIVQDLLGLGEDAVAAVARLRQLLAGDPSIHGAKKPELAP